MSQIGECSTPSLSKRGCVPRGEMEDVSGGGAVRAKFLSNGEEEEEEEKVSKDKEEERIIKVIDRR